MKILYDIFQTRLGWMGLLATEQGLRRSTLPQPSRDECFQLLGPECMKAEHSTGRLQDVREKLKRYFDGVPVRFDEEAIDVSDATEFYRASWQACRTIPAGETRTYKWLAEKAGKPNAPRAAGQSMARNRLPIIVPCHRVIAADGSLRGFGKGTTRLDLKQRLLEMEARYGAKPA